MRKMTITEALVQLKLYEKKIYNAIDNANFVGHTKGDTDKVGAKDINNFKKDAIASYNSVTDLIFERAAIKSAIVKSNATTYVTIAGKDMTVAEAIERKASIEYDELLLSKMRLQFDNATKNVIKCNNDVDKQIDIMLESFYGKDVANKARQDENAVSSIGDPYRKANEAKLVDPLNIEDKIADLGTDIDAFKADVDVILSVSNSTTYIEV